MSCASAPPRAERLHAAGSLADVELFMGAEPDSCVPSGPAWELCAWRYIGNRHPSWRALANEIGTSARVNVICEFEVVDGQLGPDPCTIHQAKDKIFRIAPTVGISASPSKLARTAQSILDGARNIDDLSRLVGDIPNRCVDGESDEQRCVWFLTGRTAGRSLLSATAGRNFKTKRFTCHLPLDGSA